MYSAYMTRMRQDMLMAYNDDSAAVTLTSSKGDSTKLRIIPASPAATGTAKPRLGDSPGTCRPDFA